MTVEVICGSMKASHIMAHTFAPLHWGIAWTIQASPTIMRNPEMNSGTMSFHIPSSHAFSSAAVIGFSPWCMRIQSFPNIGPCQTAPPTNMMIVQTPIAIQFSVNIRRKWRDKTILYYWKSEKNKYLKDCSCWVPKLKKSSVYQSLLYESAVLGIWVSSHRRYR